ncbi:glycerol-3-phosphate-binding protein [Klebsiella pneumoniae subsp. pneumoniae]|uniref:Glycerol-3-phosphate-binding protein n=1 Tax=Klebsiella pneumoniae subsp. pneumoniae TaxID=72407 RepID=A0A378AMZ7_KLEPN|nr:glycerol-3-phosphate-binding protein [Klebsiella pneumoniae subsp. pneumoniae]
MEPLHRLLLAAQGVIRYAGDEGLSAAGSAGGDRLEQLKYAHPWYSTWETVAVRKAMENQLAAVVNDAK